MKDKLREIINEDIRTFSHAIEYQSNYDLDDRLKFWQIIQICVLILNEMDKE